MDKYEYKVRADEIKDLIAQGEYVSAAEIADTIDWRRVKSVMMLCTISDLYKINRRYEDARNMLLLAYERRPGGRTICYSLCELSIKMEDFVPAVNYYKEFVQVAPRDPGRYILQYKLYEAQDVSLEERIGVLEELKKRDYREKWAYELAYLYHRVGLGTRCVEECDELIVWFGEGKYVIKAMELKMLHQPLTPAQQEKYDHRFEEYGQTYYDSQQEASQKQPYYGGQQEAAPQEQFYYETQQEAAPQEQFYYETQREKAPQEQFYYETQQEPAFQEPFYYETQQEPAPQEALYDAPVPGQPSGYDMGGKTQIYGFVSGDLTAENAQVVPQQPEELDIQVKPMDMGQYNTINLQAEIAAGLREVLEDDPKASRENEITRTIMAPLLESETESLDLPEIDEVDADDLGPEAEVMEESEVFFGETGEIADIQNGKQAADGKAAVKEIVPEIGSRRKTVSEEILEPVPAEPLPAKETAEARAPVEHTAEKPVEKTDSTENPKGKPEPVMAAEQQKADDITAETVMAQLKRESRAEEQVLTAQPPREIASVLSQESDGQIRLVVPESEQIEKQITGQMSLEDVLREWERMKQENAEKRKEEVRQHVLRHTGEMFTAFEASVRDGLLEQLESGSADIQGSAKEVVTDEDLFGSGTVEESPGGEPKQEVPVEDLTDRQEETEDWDSQPQEDSEEELETILKEAEQEVIFGDSDEVEEIEEIEEPQGADDAEGLGQEAGEEEEIAESEEITWADLEEEEEPEETAAAEPEEPEQTVGQESQPDTADKPGLTESEAAEESGSEETAKKPEPEESGKKGTEKAAAQDTGTDKPEKAAKKKPGADKESSKEDEDPSSVEREKGKVRSLTREEKELYGPYIQSRASREQLVHAIDSISMAAYTGNIVITGEEGMDTVSLAKNMIREVQMTDSNFAGKVAKISGQALNKKDVESTVQQLKSGALIIQKASGMDADTAKRLHKALQQESFGIIIILEDVKKAMNKFLEQHSELAACFTSRMDVESLSNGTLVAFGRKYAREREYSIDDMGILALHTRIDEMQTSDHVVTVLEVKELVDSAIKHANRKNLKHFFDILLARRYDEEDMIILSERDFA
ncbi:MAG: hypothetical protein NC305_02165 [Lachnospiraceae bacterium]|nr:hypothetical protein [Butyrivibrio sp.]MCM1343303.1 hypothetical protein [Muribaculaceae bacterium]MCM1409335.1 hypothetical protein [Lachnospiraceae bacterium]